ncbi:hypothetical protein [Ferrimonas marina]|uniref:Uncharacterized protein n=1 Tax=Ferrimonas marina TaxID=299255 RepID=A0A1M5UBV2_9GAMM|nr:hypothetical protein [Ferrimonas marina]SHH60398.1 hypothetical protein SAMN02745129_2491 [Ferrimonas marina]
MSMRTIENVRLPNGTALAFGPEHNTAQALANHLASQMQLENDYCPAQWEAPNGPHDTNGDVAKAALVACNKAERRIIAEMDDLKASDADINAYYRDYANEYLLEALNEMAIGDCEQAHFEYVHSFVRGEYGSVLTEVQEHLESIDADLDFGLDELETAFFTAVTDRLLQNDRSVPFHFISDCTRAELVYSPDVDWEGAWTDYYTEFDQGSNLLEAIRADEHGNLLRLFNLVGIAPGDFADYLASEPLPGGLEIAPEAIEKFRALGQPADQHTSPGEVIDNELLFHILENANYHGVPVAATYMDIRSLYHRDVTQPMKLAKVSVGIHTPCVGAGHVESINKDAELVIPPLSAPCWTGSDTLHCPPSRLYDFSVPEMTSQAA